MKAKTQILVYIGAFVALILLAAGIYIVSILGDAIKEKCETVNQWKFDEYSVTQRSCIGPVGPHYDNYLLTRNSEVIERLGYMKDSCKIVFHTNQSNQKIFDICKNEVYELRKEEGKLKR